ncbi:MAG: hypothetical protein AAB649_06230 [Patescibacteria group bacterium]
MLLTERFKANDISVKRFALVFKPSTKEFNLVGAKAATTEAHKELFDNYFTKICIALGVFIGTMDAAKIMGRASLVQYVKDILRPLVIEQADTQTANAEVVSPDPTSVLRIFIYYDLIGNIQIENDGVTRPPETKEELNNVMDNNLFICCEAIAFISRWFYRECNVDKKEFYKVACEQITLATYPATSGKIIQNISLGDIQKVEQSRVA